MLDPYYSHQPLLVLDRPVVLVGFFGARLPQIAAAFSATTGVPLGDLERMIEHQAGRSLARLVYESGVEALHQQEESLLAGLLKDSPPPIIALGAATLQHAPSARLLRRHHAQVVYVRYSLLALYGSLLDELDSATRRCWLFPGSRPESVASIQPAFARYRAGYEATARTLDADGRSPVALAGVLVSMFTKDQPS